MIHVSRHAIERAIERIPGILCEDQAVAILTTAFIERAAGFGAKFVKLGSGNRVVIEENTVVTVLPLGHRVRCRSTIADERRRHRRSQNEGV